MQRALFRFMVIVICALAGCEVHYTDVSQTPELRQLVGARYEVIGPLDAYGIREHSKADVEYITLIPPPGIGGSEVGFCIAIEPGSTITVLKVLETNRWPDPDLTLEVRLTGTRMPVGTVRVDLFRGNEGQSAAQLNPRIYRRISASGASKEGDNASH